MLKTAHKSASAASKMLTAKSAATLMQRIDDAKGALPIALDIITPTHITLSLNLQDKTRDYDWIGMAFECTEVSDASLIDNNQLSYLDWDEGITLIKEADQWGLAVGNYQSLSHLKDARLYIVAKTIKVKEFPAQL